jgi:hypothetical protein
MSDLRSANEKRRLITLHPLFRTEDQCGPDDDVEWWDFVAALRWIASLTPAEKFALEMEHYRLHPEEEGPLFHE